MSETVIRSLHPTDCTDWTILWAAYQRFYEVDIPAATSALTWERLMDSAEPVHGAIAVDAATGEALGLVHFIEHRSTWVATRSVYLEDLYVAPAARGRGTGRALIGYVADQARQIGAPGIYWLTHQTNATARTLYDSVTGGPSGFLHYQLNLDVKNDQ
ncbi:GNAT family N-acetyltransferase [Ancylobacter sp. 6x-1]|uniref:GNAT family N-acetyltransferase n=1 Tax=Ancylobacter crimeensis TaxID=2579147 RepID=A0ABT0D6V6_9HYPH|nr:GNAT family N-acetyltransferase [Ancylobacter crimeensis]MCK0195667.1 GNAT family N-acetyltransferase [Ancylobacter crimeensis]